MKGIRLGGNETHWVAGLAILTSEFDTLEGGGRCRRAGNQAEIAKNFHFEVGPKLCLSGKKKFFERGAERAHVVVGERKEQHVAFGSLRESGLDLKT